MTLPLWNKQTPKNDFDRPGWKRACLHLILIGGSYRDLLTTSQPASHRSSSCAAGSMKPGRTPSGVVKRPGVVLIDSKTYI